MFTYKALVKKNPLAQVVVLFSIAQPVNFDNQEPLL